MKLKILLGAAVAAIAVLCLWPWPTTTKPTSVAKTSAGAAPLATAELARGGAVDAEGSPATRTEASLAPAPFVLHGRLVGLHPDVPWTTPLVVRATGSAAGARQAHDGSAAVAANGSFTVTLPAWFRDGASLELRLAGRDPFYLATDTRVRPEWRSLEEPITIPVEPVSIVTGRVVDPRGTPVPGAQVCAFLPPEPRSSEPPPGETFLRCATNTDENGNYRLQVTAAAPLLLLAVPARDAGVLGGTSQRDDLLPAHARVGTRWGQVTEVPELRLTEPAFVTGSVVTGEGAPIADVEMIWIHNSADGSLYDRKLGNLMTWVDGSTGRIARTRTDRNGRFRLPATPGKEGMCYPRDAEGRPEPMVTMVRAKPPAEVTFRLDGGVAVVRVLCGGLPVTGVAVTTDSIGDQLTPYERRRKTDVRGEVRLLRSQSSSRRFTIERPGSEPLEVDVPARSSANEPLVVELPPLANVPVSIGFETADRLGTVGLSWNRLDAKVAPVQYVATYDGKEPVRCDVPSGRYEVHIAALTGEPRDSFLLDAKHPIDVPLHGCHRRLPVAHGGRVLITMTDRDGRYAYGSATLAGSTGRFTWTLGREPEDSPNVPAGSYELRIHSKNRVVHQEAVEVATCKVTSVRVRLP